MADPVSDGEPRGVKPPPKRRRILDPSAIVPVPVYSNKVSSSLRLKPMDAVFTKKEAPEGGADLWSFRGTKVATIALSDSEEEEAQPVENEAERGGLGSFRSPSPPPPESPLQKQSSQVRRKISEIDRRLRSASALVSPEPQTSTRSGRRRRPRGSPPPVSEEGLDDVVVITEEGSWSSLYSSSLHEISLKIRCRTDLHKIPVLSSTPLSNVLAQLSAILQVPPPRLLLLREDVELPLDSTVGEIGLGITDILECVVMASEDKSRDDDAAAGSSDIITVRLQSKDRDAAQEFSLHRDAPLDSVFSRYLSGMSAGARRQVCFHFDGCKVTHSQTPAQLDMEDGDIIEVWI